MKKLFGILYVLVSGILSTVNKGKPKLFIYTDSRGFNPVSKFGKNPFASYVGKLLFKYNVTYFICKEKHTTILDFLAQIKSFDIESYQYVIMHCGVVDFSPRPLSNLNFVLKSKQEDPLLKIAKNTFGDYYENPSNVFYKGEATQSLYAPEFLEDVLIPELKKVKKLIWISSNHFVPGWEGNFTKGRPLNIEEYVARFDSIMTKHIENIVDIRDWNDDEVKKYTIDNIHFTKEGFSEVFRRISKKIEN